MRGLANLRIVRWKSLETCWKKFQNEPRIENITEGIKNNWAGNLRLLQRSERVLLPFASAAPLCHSGNVNLWIAFTACEVLDANVIEHINIRC